MAQPNYKLKDDHVMVAKHGRDLYNTLDTAKLNKSGGVITGDIYSVSDTNPLNALATKQYVIDNAGGGGSGGGGHPDKIESQDALKSTSVLCTTDGVTISDDSTAIAIISKSADGRTQIKGELVSGAIAINSNDLLIRSQDGATDILNITSLGAQSTVPIRYSDPLYVPSLDTELIHKKYMDDADLLKVNKSGDTMTGNLNMGSNKVESTAVPSGNSDLTNKLYVDGAIETAKLNVSQLIDKNTDGTTTNNYRLKIDNNQLEFSRDNNPTEDIYLKLFGSSTAGSDGVIQQTNRSNFYFESEDKTSVDNNLYLSHTFSADPTDQYQKSAPLRLSQGSSLSGAIPYARLSAINLEAGGTNANLILNPSNSKTTALANKIRSNLRLGYDTNALLTDQDGFSILNRNESDSRNDGRYYANTTRLDQIVAPQNAVTMNNQKLTQLADATSNSDAVNLDQLTKARQGFSVVRKTTTALTANTKVSGFTIQQESNASKCYWDNANQYFLVSIPVGDASVDVEFRVRITYNITATGNNATFVLRDFTNNTNYADTFLYATKQNQNGYFTETLSIIKNFTTNRFVGLYVTAQNGNPPFANLDIVMQAVTITTSTQVNIGNLSNPGGTKTVSIDAEGLKADQLNSHTWDLKGGYLRGINLDLYNEPFPGDYAASLDYVNTLVSAQGQTQAQIYLTNADGYVFGPSGLVNAHAFKNVATNEDRFIIQTDVPANCTTLSVGQALNLNYWGTKTLADNSLMTKADVQALIAAQGGRRSWVMWIKLGNLPPPASITSYESSPPGQISSVTYLNSASIARVTINHADPGYNYRVFVNMYSDSISTSDNDGGSQTYWSYSPSRTQTVVLFEYNAESNTQNVGYNVMLMEM